VGPGEQVLCYSPFLDKLFQNSPGSLLVGREIWSESQLRIELIRPCQCFPFVDLKSSRNSNVSGVPVLEVSNQHSSVKRDHLEHACSSKSTTEYQAVAARQCSLRKTPVIALRISKRVLTPGPIYRAMILIPLQSKRWRSWIAAWKRWYVIKRLFDISEHASQFGHCQDN
jgi:hypothetical protein